MKLLSHFCRKILLRIRGDNIIYTNIKKVNIHTYHMLWFNFILSLNFLFFSFKLFFIHYHTPKQKKIKFKPRIKLNHNIYMTVQYGFGYKYIYKKKTVWKKEKSNTRKLKKTLGSMRKSNS